MDPRRFLPGIEWVWRTVGAIVGGGVVFGIGRVLIGQVGGAAGLGQDAPKRQQQRRQQQQQRLVAAYEWQERR